MTPNPLACLCASCREALAAIAGGKVIRIPRDPKVYTNPLEARIRQEHDANLRVYEMTEAQSVRDLAHRHRLTHAEVRSLL